MRSVTIKKESQYQQQNQTTITTNNNNNKFYDHFLIKKLNNKVKIDETEF